MISKKGINRWFNISFVELFYTQVPWRNVVARGIKLCRMSIRKEL